MAFGDCDGDTWRGLGVRVWSGAGSAGHRPVLAGRQTERAGRPYLGRQFLRCVRQSLTRLFHG